MALGRIKRGSSHSDRFDRPLKNSVWNKGGHPHTSRISAHNITIKAEIRRQQRNYGAKMCFATKGEGRDKHGNVDRSRTCAYGSGRTPQSALAKAAKSFSKKIALRGRRKPKMKKSTSYPPR